MTVPITVTEYAVRTPERHKFGRAPLVMSRDAAVEFVAAHSDCLVVSRTIRYTEWVPASD